MYDVSHNIIHVYNLFEQHVMTGKVIISSVHRNLCLCMTGGDEWMDG